MKNRDKAVNIAIFTALIALFWVGAWIITGHVPKTHPITLLPWKIQLPSVSRWWDVLLGPLLSILVIGSFACCGNAEANSGRAVRAGTLIGLFLGIALGPVAHFNPQNCFYIMLLAYVFFFIIITELGKEFGMGAALGLFLVLSLNFGLTIGCFLLSPPVALGIATLLCPTMARKMLNKWRRQRARNLAKDLG